MQKKNVEAAWGEAKRFMDRVTDWIERAKTDPYIEMGSKEGGALRRSSLDLTRALAKMRKY